MQIQLLQWTNLPNYQQILLVPIPNNFFLYNLPPNGCKFRTLPKLCRLLLSKFGSGRKSIICGSLKLYSIHVKCIEVKRKLFQLLPLLDNSEHFSHYCISVVILLCHYCHYYAIRVFI